ncbi:MAG: cobalamin biosynthesis protein, partial [Methanophagales archaeon]|nr:cobalamin biosynthesis protein [Methanophagales archaeon]
MSVRMKSREVYIGIGFHRGVEAEEMESAIRRFLEELGIELKEVKGLCTVDFRKTEQLEKVSSLLKKPLFSFSP